MTQLKQKKKVNRRKWNNILIMIILGFILLIKAPAWLAGYLSSSQNYSSQNYSSQNYSSQSDLSQSHSSQSRSSQSKSSQDNHSSQQVVTLTLLIPGETIDRIDGAKWSKANLDESTQSRWLSIQGTAVNHQTYQALTRDITPQQTIEVWYHDREEPQRITVYRLDRFWLMNNWQNEWIAITLEPNTLFPEVP
ncbi:hypothetical protein N9R79_08995 [Vibrio sp.]|nr:hypothetical protein [Vibrio sp.]